MAVESGINWTDAGFSPWIGCTQVSEGCFNCYAERSMPAKLLGIAWGAGKERYRTRKENWLQPLKWQRSHLEFFGLHGRKRMVFCAPLADVFDNQIDPSWRIDLWQLIANTPDLEWQILTKRIGNVQDMLPSDWGKGYPNVWLGITVVNQDEAIRDIPKLLRVPAKIHWLSLEPLLGPVGLVNIKDTLDPNLGFLDWVVAGGESGRSRARSMKPEWLASIKGQCGKLGIPFFFKQWGGTTRDKGGCLYEGFEHKEWPNAH